MLAPRPLTCEKRTFDRVVADYRSVPKADGRPADHHRRNIAFKATIWACRRWSNEERAMEQHGQRDYRKVSRRSISGTGGALDTEASGSRFSRYASRRTEVEWFQGLDCCELPSRTPSGISSPAAAPTPAPTATPIGPPGTPRPAPASVVAATRPLALSLAHAVSSTAGATSIATG